MSRYTSPRALGLLSLALVLIAATVVLGLWQLGVYDSRQHQDAEAALARPAVPLDEVLGPDEPMPAAGVDRPVRVEGRYVGGDQFYVDGLDGAPQRFAVVTPLLTASGSAILVVRGANDVAQASVPGSDVRIEGVLEPAQPNARPLSAARVTNAIDVASMVSEVDDDLYDGYVVLRSSSPADGLTRVQPPEPDGSRWAGFRNLMYAFQWWLFGCFVAFMWWRVVNDADDLARTDVG